MQITVAAKGARTIAQSRPLMFEGQNVYVTIDSEGFATLTLAGRVEATKRCTWMSAAAAQAWAYEVIGMIEEADAVIAGTEDAAPAEADPIAVIEALGGVYTTREKYTDHLRTLSAAELIETIKAYKGGAKAVLRPGGVVTIENNGSCYGTYTQI